MPKVSLRQIRSDAALTCMQVFLYVAATPSNNFMIGTMLPSASITHQHFCESLDPSMPCQIELQHRWNEMFFFR
jgi:hypothetical protein